MVLGASSHRAEHWWFMNGGTQFDSDVNDPEFADFYGPALREEVAPNEQFLEDWLLRTVELVDRHRPQVVWFDWWIETPAFEPYLRLFAAYYYNAAARWGREVVINYKWKAFADGSAVYDVERGALQGIHPRVWQNDTSVGRTSWSWVPGQDYKSVPELVAELVDVVAKNGVLLLNVGPKADGTLAPEEVELLHGIGRWLDVHGEAVFGTHPWVLAGEGPTQLAAGSFVDATAREYTGEDVRFTVREDPTGTHLYATALGAVTSGTLRVRSWGSAAGLLDEFDDLRVLGADGPVASRRTADALEVDLPADWPSRGRRSDHPAGASGAAAARRVALTDRNHCSTPATWTCAQARATSCWREAMACWMARCSSRVRVVAASWVSPRHTRARCSGPDRVSMREARTEFPAPRAIRRWNSWSLATRSSTLGSGPSSSSRSDSPAISSSLMRNVAIDVAGGSSRRRTSMNSSSESSCWTSTTNVMASSITPGSRLDT